jgi:hypothetical protein
MKLREFKEIYWGMSFYVDRDNEDEYHESWTHGCHMFAVKLRSIYRADNDRPDEDYLKHSRNKDGVRLKPWRMRMKSKEGKALKLMPFNKAKKWAYAKLEERRTYHEENDVIHGRNQYRFHELPEGHYDEKVIVLESQMEQEND